MSKRLIDLVEAKVREIDDQMAILQARKSAFQELLVEIGKVGLTLTPVNRLGRGEDRPSAKEAILGVFAEGPDSIWIARDLISHLEDKIYSKSAHKRDVLGGTISYLVKKGLLLKGAGKRLTLTRKGREMVGLSYGIEAFSASDSSDQEPISDVES